MNRLYVDTRIGEDIKGAVIQVMEEEGRVLSKQTWGVVRQSATRKAAVSHWITSRDFLWLAATTLRQPPRTPVKTLLANLLEAYVHKAASTVNELREGLDN